MCKHTCRSDSARGVLVGWGRLVVGTTRDGSTVAGSSWRARYHDLSTRLYGPSPSVAWLSWVYDQRIAIGAVPTAESLNRLRNEGVTHIVNCRATIQVLFSGDLAMERAIFGVANVKHAPMWDSGRMQDIRRWAAAAIFAANVIEQCKTSRVFIHCQQGRHRAVLVGYAALRVLGHSSEEAVHLILRSRAEAELLQAYKDSVDDWLLTR